MEKASDQRTMVKTTLIGGQTTHQRETIPHLYLYLLHCFYLHRSTIAMWLVNFNAAPRWRRKYVTPTKDGDAMMYADAREVGYSFDRKLIDDVVK